MLGIPAYLKMSDYRNPTNVADGPFQYSHNTQSTHFRWLADRPEHLQRFNNYMKGCRERKRSWMDPGFYPVKERLENGFKKDQQDSVFLVDVGGGLGHDLEELKAKHADLPGSLVLQDQAAVIAQIGKASPGIELTAHDFFTPQPVKGEHRLLIRLNFQANGSYQVPEHTTSTLVCTTGTTPRA